MVRVWSALLKAYVLRLVSTQKGVDILYRLTQVLETIGLPKKVAIKCRRGLIFALQSSGRLPSTFKLDNVVVMSDAPPLGIGSFATVYRGVRYKNEVAVKRFHLSCKTLRATKQRFIKETLILQSLNHPNILPFIGVVHSKSEVSIICPIMEYGHVKEFLLRKPSAPKLELVKQIANGLLYLKNRKIVHGDLKGVNILVDGNENIRITDFGLANYFLHEANPPLRQYLIKSYCCPAFGSKLFDHTDSASTGSDVGTIRWMSPERFFPMDGETSVRATFASDIFSFAMVIYEIYSGHVPFHNINNMMATLAIVQDKRPERDFEIPDDLWELVNHCWKISPIDRPPIEQVIHYLSLVGAKSGVSKVE